MPFLSLRRSIPLVEIRWNLGFLLCSLSGIMARVFTLLRSLMLIASPSRLLTASLSPSTFTTSGTISFAWLSNTLAEFSAEAFSPLPITSILEPYCIYVESAATLNLIICSVRFFSLPTAILPVPALREAFSRRHSISCCGTSTSTKPLLTSMELSALPNLFISVRLLSGESSFISAVALPFTLAGKSGGRIRLMVSALAKARRLSLILGSLR